MCLAAWTDSLTSCAGLNGSRRVGTGDSFDGVVENRSCGGEVFCSEVLCGGMRLGLHVDRGNGLAGICLEAVCDCSIFLV